MSNIPEGFTPIFRSSPYLDLIGPLYNLKSKEGLIVALRAEEKHCNARGTVHGGVFSTMADVALGYNAAFSGESPVPMVTASLTIDYVGSAKLGDWITVEVDVQKVGKTMAFANCYFMVDSKRIARASAVFNVINT